jgi:hypothetical protein
VPQPRSSTRAPAGHSFEKLLDHAYLAVLVREDLVVMGSDRVEAGRLCALPVGPVVARGRLGHLGILP